MSITTLREVSQAVGIILAIICFCSVNTSPETGSSVFEETETETRHALSFNTKESKRNTESQSDENTSSISPLISFKNGNNEIRFQGSSNPDSSNIKFRERNSESQNGVFFTKLQTTQHLKFPNEIVNPNNRLQLTHEELATISPEKLNSSLEESKSESSEFFFKRVFNKSAPVLSPQDAVRTMSLTLNIVQNSLWGEENIVFSPLSICNVLALLLLGSSGKTENELSSVLNIKNSSKLPDGDKNRRFHGSFRKLLGTLNLKSGTDVVLEIANQVFIDKSFSLNSPYVSEALKFYETPVDSFNFGTEGKLFKEKVNEWVRQKTKSKIRTIVDEPPSPSTTLAFVNAVYFKGDWEVPFIERITQTRPFHIKENETVNVEMMKNELNIPFLDHEEFQMAGIPYKGNRTGFFIILPKSSDSDGIENLRKVERTICANDFTEHIWKMKPQKVHVKIPKLKIQNDGHMKQLLSTLGVPSMFDPTLANFTKISPSDGLYVSAVHHRAMIEVNEKGTEAAAVTFGSVDRIIDEIPIPFNVNKPFIFFIYNIKADTVLFWGRVTRPVWT